MTTNDHRTPARGRRRALWIALGVLASAASALGVVTYRSVKWELSTIHPPRQPVARAAADVLGAVEDATFTTSDGLTIHGWYRPTQNGAVVVLGHGWGGNREQLLPEAGMLVRHGYGVLMFDWRAHGESDGDTCTWGDAEKKDLVAALDWVTAHPGVDHDRIGALGFSFGGGIVIDVAAVDPRIKAVVTEGTTPTLADEITENSGRFKIVAGPVARWAMGRELDVAAVRPIDHVCAIAPRPILIVNGDDGHDNPERLAEQLYAAACDPKEYWHVAGASHGDYAQRAPAELESRLLAVYDRALAPRASADR